MGMKFATSTFFALLLLPFLLFAQPPGGGGRPNGGPQIDLAPATGGLLGMVLDQQTEEPILLANVLIFRAGTRDLLGGTTTNERGFFVVKDLPYATYDLEVSYLGYEDWHRETVILSENERIQRLGRVFLTSGTADLAEIEVTAERAAVEFGLDRRVFNVEKDIASSGGTAEDLLRNIPSVTVDLDGNISLRGSSNIRILINGKPSALTGLDRQGFLQQLAAGTIERIEVLTNPSAKYDPEGMGGIINIIMKQQNRQGFNVQTSVNVGTNDKYNGNLNLNYRVGKFNLQTGYSYNYDNRFFRGNRFRTTETADTTWFLDQKTDGDRQRISQTLTGAVEYFVSPRASLAVKGNYSDQSSNNTSARDNLYLDPTRNPFLRSVRREIGDETENNWELNLDYRQRFRTEGRELSMSAQHSETDQQEQANFFEDFTEPDGAFLYTTRQQNPQPQLNDLWLFQADYTHPLSKKTTLEAGSRVSLRGVNIDNKLLDYDAASDAYVFNQTLSNLFDYQENVYAGYGIVKGSGGPWEWQAGVRAEQTNTEALLLEPSKQVFPNNYFSLFPSAFLTYKLSEQTGIQFNYSRRINRPNFRALNPFIDYDDPLNPRGGNPLLLPEFINSYEFNYLRSSEQGSLTLTGYFREINDMITRITTPDLTTGVNLRTFANLNRGRNYGLEVIGTLRPVDKLQLVISGNAYRTEIDGNNLESDLNTAGYLFSGRFQSSYTLGKDWGLQLTGFYRSPGVTAQGEMRQMYSVDFGVRKPVLKGKGTITLRATDLFNTRKWGSVTTAQGITDDSLFQRESRIAYLGFSYSLRQDKRSSRDRGDRREGGGMDDGGGEF
ncbi:MAG: TonB-dependent receptor [Bacteroidetes bacterium]|nr:MAG: TonB-dependent receptor [Bacteroidota bacterium]PTM09917.1 MAG: TonB-dependent receptor [Bacteroidota bacterium]